MLIHLHKSKLFTEAPELRFAREYRVDPQLWKDLWKKHAFMDYSLRDLCEYYELKAHKKTTAQSMQRWIWRTYVYGKAQDVIKKDVKVVNSEFFGNYEIDVVKELTKNLKPSSGVKSTKAFI